MHPFTIKHPYGIAGPNPPAYGGNPFTTTYTLYTILNSQKTFAARPLSPQIFWKIQFLNYTVYILLHTAAIRNILFATTFIPSLSIPLTQAAGPNPPAYGGNPFTTTYTLTHFTQFLKNILSHTSKPSDLLENTQYKIQNINYTHTLTQILYFSSHSYTRCVSLECPIIFAIDTISAI